MGRSKQTKTYGPRSEEATVEKENRRVTTRKQAPVVRDKSDTDQNDDDNYYDGASSPDSRKSSPKVRRSGANSARSASAVDKGQDDKDITLR